jgi:serine/threonine-protein kinase
LKPSNILVDANGRPFVTDFGLIKIAASELTATGAIIGTPSYMSPEQAASRHHDVGPRSDIYSLGAILYELLTGRPPFLEASPLETLVQVLEGEPTAPRQVRPRVPVELELICLKAMAKAPEDRYATAEDLAVDLERFLRSEPISARPHGLGRRLVRWARQEPGLVSRLGILAACAIVVQTFYHLQHLVTPPTQVAIMLTLAVWAGICLMLQLLLRREYRPQMIRQIWVVADGIMLTAALIIARDVATPLTLCYGAMIVGAGLWFRTELVWVALGVSSIGYVVLVVLGAIWDVPSVRPQQHIIAIASLLLIANMVALQIRRVRALSRYYQR